MKNKNKIFEQKFKAVKEKVGTHEIIKLYGIKTNNSNFSICPFHNDNRPSMSWSKDKGLIKCFACMEKAVDPIGFVEKYEGLSFRDAVEFLFQKFVRKLERVNANIVNEKIKKIKIKNNKQRISKKEIDEYLLKVENILNLCFYFLRDFYQVFNPENNRIFNFSMAKFYYDNITMLEMYDELFNSLKAEILITRKFKKEYVKQVYKNLFSLYNKINDDGGKLKIKYVKWFYMKRGK